MKKGNTSPMLFQKSPFLFFKNGKANLILICSFFCSNFLLGQFTFNGDAVDLGGNCWRLTPEQTNKAGSVFSTSTIDLNQPFFTDAILNFGDRDGTGADGMVFVFTTANNIIGNTGGDIGYGGPLFNPSLAVEFDTWQNNAAPGQNYAYGDPAQDHIAIQKNGDPNHNGPNNLDGPVTLPNIEDGLDHCFSIDWDPVTQVLTATLDGNSLTHTGDIVNNVFGGNSNVFWGYTASTGGSFNLHTVCINGSTTTIDRMDDVTICAGEDVVLTPDPNGINYTWDFEPSLSDTDIENPTADPVVTTTYTVTIDFQCGTSVIDDVEVTVAPPLPIALEPAGPFCVDDPNYQLVFSPPGGTWDGPVSSSGVFNPASAGDGDHDITYSYSGSCDVDTVITITVNPLPDIFFDPIPDFCIDDSDFIVGVDPLGGTWTGNIQSDGTIPISVLGVGSYNATYSVTDGNGCFSSDNIAFSINPLPVVSIDPVPPICENEDPFFLIGNPLGGDWIGDIGSDDFDPGFWGVGTYTAIYEYEDGFGCINLDTIMITVLEAPTPTIDEVDPVCPEAVPFALVGDPAGGTWGGVADAAGIITPFDLGSGVHEATYTVGLPNGCVETFSRFIDIIDEEEIFFLTNSPYCLPDQTYQLDADPFGGTWGGGVEVNGEFNPIDFGVGTHTITYEYETPEGCIFIDSVDINIIQAGGVTFGDSIFCKSLDSVFLTASPNGGLWSGTIVSADGKIYPSTLNTGVYEVVYTLASQSGSCNVIDTLNVRIEEGPNLEIIGDSTFCLNTDTISFVGNPLGGAWAGIADSLGRIFPNQLSLGFYQVGYSDTSAAGCIDTIFKNIEILTPPTVEISGGGSICPSGNQEATLIFNLTGNSPWVINYMLDSLAQISFSADSTPFELVVNQAGTYEIIDVTDSLNCFNIGSGTAIVTELTPITISNLMTNCNPNGLDFTMQFEITGGDPSSYMVAGVAGTISSIAPYIFTSGTIASGTTINFTISDDSGCVPFSDQIFVDCACQTAVGTMDSDPIIICGQGTATAIYDNAGEFLESGDALEFIFHTTSGVSLGSVLGRKNVAGFSFSEVSAAYGVTYYISAVAGNSNGAGGVDLTDPCLQVAAGTPVTFYEIPTAVLSGNVRVCKDSLAQFQLNFTGQQPYSVRLSDGVNTIDLNGITTDIFNYNFNPSENGSFSIIEFRDNFCDGTFSGNASVNLNASPEIADIEYRCNPTRTSYQVILTLTGGDPFSYQVSGLSGSIFGNIWTSDPIPDGQGFQVFISDGNGCPPTEFSNPGHDCGCATAVGEMAPDLIEVCGLNTASANYDPTLEFLDSDDIVEFVLHTNSTNSLGTILEKNSIPNFAFNSLSMSYDVTYYISAVAGNDDGSGNVDLSNDPCLAISFGTPVIFRRISEAILSGDASICLGADTVLQIDFTGTNPYEFRLSENGVIQTFSTDQNPYFLPVNPTGNTTYNLVSIQDAYCPGNVSGSAEISINTAPQIRNLQTECSQDKLTYIVTFEIIDGDAATYEVTGISGTLSGNIFISDPLPSGNAYSFEVFDGNRCEIIEIDNPSVNCPCDTDAGTMRDESLQVCENEMAIAFHNFDDFLDSNDALIFVLHDGSSASLGSILIQNDLPNFDFDDAVLDFDIQYFVAAIAGNTDPVSGVDFNDICLSISNGVPVIFRSLPTAQLTGDQTICEGDNVDLEFTFSGLPTFNISYSVNGQIENLTGLPSNHILNINPSQSTTYQLIEISNQYCTNTANDAVNITVNTPPFATLLPSGEICNSTESGETTVFDFQTLLTDGDRSGDWTDDDFLGAAGSFPMLDFSGVLPGSYDFSYTTNSALPPCQEQTYTVEIIVSDCSCPSVEISNAGPFCNDDVQVVLDDLKITTEDGNWSILNVPIGSIAQISNGIFYATGSVAGDYELQFSLTQMPIGSCPDNSIITITISEIVSAGTSSGKLEICNDGTSLNLPDELSGATLGGVWTDISATPAVGFFDGPSGTLNTQNIPSGTYEFQYTVAGQAPCPDDFSTIVVEIDNPVSAGDLVQNLAFCESADTSMMLFDYLRNFDLGGDWSLVSGSQISTTDFDNSTSFLNIKNLNSDSYLFDYQILANGICPNDNIQIEVEINQNPMADAGEDQELDCLIRTVTLGGTNTSSGSDFDYFWSGNLDAPTVQNPTTTLEGTYILTVTDKTTGCFSTDETEVIETIMPPTLNANSIEITCFGDSDGEIIIENVSGGTPPFLYSLNGAPFADSAIFNNLSSGDYNLRLEDSEGCTDELNFTIFEPDELTVSISTNLSIGSNLIQYGDSVQLTANVSTNFDSIQWSPPESFEPCDPESDPLNCITNWVHPTEVTTYEVFVINKNGCSDRSSVTIDVEFIENVFIPSAFSPNDDGINDFFQIYTDANVERIKSFLVFDRWGNTIFKYTDFAPNDPAAVWDGRFRGKRMDPGVFAYFAEVEFKNGEEKLYEGDVSLLK